MIEVALCLKDRTLQTITNCTLSGLKLQFKLFDKTTTLIASINRIVMRDYFTQSTEFPNIIFPTSATSKNLHIFPLKLPSTTKYIIFLHNFLNIENAKDDIFYCKIEMNGKQEKDKVESNQEKEDYNIDLSIKPLNIVINHSLLHRISLFFKQISLEEQSLLDLELAAFMKIDEFQKQAKMKLKEVLLIKKMTILLNVNCTAPNILLPLNPTDSSSPLLIFILGNYPPMTSFLTCTLDIHLLIFLFPLPSPALSIGNLICQNENLSSVQLVRNMALMDSGFYHFFIYFHSLFFLISFSILSFPFLSFFYRYFGE